MRSRAEDAQTRQRGAPPSQAQDVATQVRLGLRMRARPRRFSIAHPRRRQTSDPVVAALSFDNEAVRMWGDDMNTGMGTSTAVALQTALPTVVIEPGSPQGSHIDVAAFLLGLPQAQPARTSAAGA